MGLNDLKILLLKEENRLYTLLLIWLLIGYIALNIFALIDLPIIGIIIYAPLLSFTLFLFLLNVFGKNVKEKNIKQLIIIFIISIPIMFILVIVLIALFLISVISYIVLTAVFLLASCYNSGVNFDEKIYYKKGKWLFRLLEFFGGLIFALIVLAIVGESFRQYLLKEAAESEPFLTSAFTIMIISIIFLAIVNLISLIFKKFNAWLGLYFIFVSLYAVYLIYKVISGTTKNSSDKLFDPLMFTALMVFDIFLIILSFGSILSRAEIINEKLKVLSADSLLLWLIFAKGAWEFMDNLPFQFISMVPNTGLIGEVLYNFGLYTNILVMLFFIFLVWIFGLYGIIKYFKRQKELSFVKKELVE
ncbi:MAG: hypothetical protein ACTSR8_08010 [Promethearchaeota archaeon]